jgi:NADH-quinone oxidoreductase subunit G
VTDVVRPEAPTTVAVTIDGVVVEAHPDELIIEAADRVGVFIPRFCYHPHMEPVGMCRMCLVEVSGPRGFSLQPACYFKVTDGMEVRTASTLAQKAQEGVLEFLLVNHPLDCPVCDKGGECPLQDQALSHGPGESRFIEEKRHWAKPIEIGPFVALDRERCIQCARCTRFAEEIAGEALIDFFERGDKIEVAPFPGRPFSSYFSGNTVQICPVGALTATPYRFKARPWDLEQVESTCTTCAVGCRVAAQSSAGHLVRFLGVDALEVNESWLCDKGRFAIASIYAPDRLTTPQVRRNATLETATWGEALTRTAAALRTAVAAGEGRIGIIGGARLANEDAFAWSKFARTVLRTNDLDAQLDDGLAPEAVVGLPAATIADAAGAKVLIVLAGDPREELPILYLRIRAAMRAGQRVVVLSPHAHALEADGAVRVGYLPGEAPAVVAALTSGSSAGGATPASVDPGSLEAARAVLDGVDGGEVVVVLGRPSLAESDAATLLAADHLARARPGVRFLSALRRANVRGAIDMGLAPGLLPGRTSLDAGRAWFERAWGTVPAAPGRDTLGMLRAARDGEIDVLILLGADPVTDVPDRALAAAALERCGFVLALGTHPDASNAYADVVLPVAGDGERSGTTTNIEGRVTHLAAKVVPPGVARAPWVVASELASRLGGDLGAESLEAFLEEIDHLAPAYAGIARAYTDAAARRDGVVVPVATPNPGALPLIDPIATPGIASVVGQGAPMYVGSAPVTVGEPDAAMSTSTEAGRPPAVAFTAPPAADTPTLADGAFRLMVIRTLYDAGTIGRTTPALAPLVPAPTLEIHPEDCARLGVGSGSRVKVTSAHGALEATVEVADADALTERVVLLRHTVGAALGTLIGAGDAVTDVAIVPIGTEAP